MKNFRYRVDDIDIILSAEEHEAVKKQFEAGKSPVFLRGGGLALNKGFVRYVVETEQLTEVQEKERRERLKLPESRIEEINKNPNYFTRSKGEFYEKMGWKE